MYIGNKIRSVRKALNLTIKQLAEKANLSYLTLQKIETDKVSPSVVTLARIADCLDSPISLFLERKKKSIVVIKRDEQSTIETIDRSLKLLLPKGVTIEGGTIWLGKTRKGVTINPHRNKGFEFAYVIKGHILFKYGNENYELGRGDAIYYDATELHCHHAIEAHEYLGIHFFKGIKEKINAEEIVGLYETAGNIMQDGKTGLKSENRSIRHENH
jgi:transcriptional regulator with XRE-family HTH domain